MEIVIKTGYNKAFKWYQKNGIWFIGYFFDNNNQYITGKKAIEHFSGCKSFDDFKTMLSDADGIYSVIVKNNDQLYAASDRSRFFTLFYTQVNNKFIISDDYYDLVELQDSKRFNEQAVAEFLSWAISNDKRTLFENIYQVRPGDSIHFKDKEVSNEYFISVATKPDEYLSNNYDELIELGYQAFEIARKRLTNSLKNKKVLLPLSSGFDSRLIAAWLKNSGIDNVICFTFGRKDAPEVNISEKVAKQLGYQWHNIEYNQELIKGFINNEDFNEFYHYLSRGSSMFYMQEYFALRKLLNEGVIDDSYVVIPGHAGGFLAGNNLVRAIPLKNTIKNQENYLLNHYYRYITLNSKQKKQILNGLKLHLAELREYKKESTDYSLLEDWLMKERITKYIFTSSHAFTFFELEVRLPFWDNTLFEFWRKVPGEHRCYKKLFKDILNTKYFEPLGIKQEQELQPSIRTIRLQNIKNKIRPWLPLWVKHKLLKKNDWVFYDEITQPFLQELKQNGIKPKDNGITYIPRIMYWYLMKMEEKFFVER